MSARFALLLLGTLLLAPATEAVAQEAPQLAPGSRIKVSARHTHIGTLLALNGTTLQLRRDALRDTVSIPLGTIRKLEVSTGRTSSVGRGALIGGAVGGGIGPILGVGAAAEDCPSDAFCVVDFGPEVIPIAVLTMGGAGALLGALIGAASPADRWEDVPLVGVKVGIAPLRGGGLGIGASVAF